jgi:diguanylate cyclase (GGDEF)-like protein
VQVDPVYAIVVGTTAWFAGAVAAALLALLAVLLTVVPDLVAVGAKVPMSVALWNTIGTLVLYVATALAIAALRRALTAERAAARTDPLTGLPNRRAFQDTLEAEVDRSQRYGSNFSVAYLDLDGFKAINDRHGHEAGDAALRLIGSILSTRLREADVAARLGGDEFALLLAETDLNGARQLTERLRGTIFEGLRDRGWPVTVSVGLYSPAGTELDAREIVRRADRLMYDAKREGKDQIRGESAAPAPPVGDAGRDRPS